MSSSDVVDSTRQFRPLHFACRVGELEKVQHLIEVGVLNCLSVHLHEL